MTEYLFAYGLLKKEYASDPKYNVPTMAVKYLGSGRLSGRLYQVAHYPGFVFDENSEIGVKGDIYEVDPGSDFFYQMDQYECALPLFVGEHEYVRRKRQVKLNHDFLECWVYEYDLPVTDLPEITTGNF